MKHLYREIFGQAAREGEKFGLYLDTTFSHYSTQRSIHKLVHLSFSIFTQQDITQIQSLGLQFPGYIKLVYLWVLRLQNCE